MQNSNVKFKILLITISFILMLNFTNVTLAMFDPGGGGGGGGSPPVAPTLNQPQSPDYDHNIELTWNHVSGATSYRVYRSDSQEGPFSLIKTTSLTYYTDVRDMGCWYYKVKACNSYGTSGFSNLVKVMVPNQFNHLYVENGRVYSPIETTLWSSNYDDAVVSINARQITDENGNTNIYNAHFIPNIMFSINPDDDPQPLPPYYMQSSNYLHSFKLLWKIKDPNGDYLSSFEICNIEVKLFSYQGDTHREEMDRFIDLIFALYQLMPYSIGADLLKLLFKSSYTDSTFNSGSDSDFDYWVKWTVGYHYTYPFGIEPNILLNEASMLVEIEPCLPNLLYGTYTFEFYYELVIYRFELFLPFGSENYVANHYHVFTLTGNYFIQWNYIN